MRIATERLVLREFREDDWPAVLAYQSDPRYLRHTPWTERAEADVRDLVGTFVGWQRERPRRRFQLAVETKADRALIGTCGVRLDDADGGQAETGWELDPRRWGRGYATEAARAVVGFGFAELGLHRVWAECVAENAGSVRVMEKLGMRREAVFREHRWFRGRRWDTVVYAVLGHEWRSSLGGAGRPAAEPAGEG